MCKFVEVLEKIKSSSVESVANKEFSDFNKYMHIPTEMDNELEIVIRRAVGYPKSLVLVCGNSGDGKSHLIGKMMTDGIIKETEFDVYIDATSSDKKGLFANDKLKEKLMPYIQQVRHERKLDMIYVMLTNILEESSEIIFVGESAKETAQKAFHGHAVDRGDSLWLKGVVSRKKQLIPALMLTLQEK